MASRHPLRTYAVVGLIFAGCSTETPGISVDVVVAAPSSPKVADAARTMQTDQGYAVTLTRGFLAGARFDLGGCQGAQTRRFRLRDLVEGTAYAHETGSPTHVGTPYVEPLVIDDASATMGTLAPPPGSYCTGTFGVDAADDDAPGLPSADMIGRSLWLEGTWTKDGASGPVAITSTKAFDAGPLRFSAPITLGEGAAMHATLVVSTLADHWFDGVDFANDGGDAIESAVLTNIQSSIAIDVRLDDREGVAIAFAQRERDVRQRRRELRLQS